MDSFAAGGINTQPSQALAPLATSARIPLKESLLNNRNGGSSTLLSSTPSESIPVATRMPSTLEDSEPTPISGPTTPRETDENIELDDVEWEDDIIEDIVDNETSLPAIKGIGAGPWTDEEHIALLQALINIDWKGDCFALASKQLFDRGFKRSASACKRYWSRKGANRSGFHSPRSGATKGLSGEPVKLPDGGSANVKEMPKREPKKRRAEDLEARQPLFLHSIHRC